MRTKTQKKATTMAAKKTTKSDNLRSSSESQIAGMIAKMFGVVPMDNLDRVFSQIADVHWRVFPELRQEFRLYPWECPLPAFVMAEKINTLVEDLAGSGGLPYVVKDSAGIGKSGLWVVRASFNDDDVLLPFDLPVRALVNHFLIGDEWLRVTAYQLETCLRKLKTQQR